MSNKKRTILQATFDNEEDDIQKYFTCDFPGCGRQFKQRAHLANHYKQRSFTLKKKNFFFHYNNNNNNNRSKSKPKSKSNSKPKSKPKSKSKSNSNSKSKSKSKSNSNSKSNSQYGARRGFGRK